MQLIIGKNSAIVKEISHLLTDFEFLSHQDIAKTDLSAYEKIFLFSWSHTNFEDNTNLLNLLNLKNVVFISTIAVQACARRPQWASYPNWKLACEKRVLQAGGKVIRIGIWDQSLLNGLPGSVPVTTPEILVNTMNESINSPQSVFFPIVIKPGQLTGGRKKVSDFLNFLSLFLPTAKLIQLPLALLTKVFVSKDYGYTHDCISYVNKRAVVGYGAIGSRISKKLNHINIPHSVIMAQDENLFLNSNGFRGLRVGLFREGLSNLWHGVWISNEDDKYPRKNVPLIVSRPKAKRSAMLAKVDGVSFSESIQSLKLDNNIVPDTHFFAERIHLAAGAINNVKILQSSFPVVAQYSDHEVGEVGSVSSKELVEQGLISTCLGFVWGRKITKGQQADKSYMVDFRPKGPDSINFDAENIYNNRTDQIMRKLLKSMSFRLINQAVFNKLGVSLNVDRFSVVVQVEAPGTITLAKDGSLSRERLSNKTLQKIFTQIGQEFTSFQRTEEPRMVDAIHVHGGFKLEKYAAIKTLIDNKTLFLHGTALDGSPLGPFHHTRKMINKELETLGDI